MQGALKFSPLNKIHVFQCMDKIFCVEFLYLLKYNTKYLNHTLKDMFYTTLKFWELISVFETPRVRQQLCTTTSYFTCHGRNSDFIGSLVSTLETRKAALQNELQFREIYIRAVLGTMFKDTGVKTELWQICFVSDCHVFALLWCQRWVSIMRPCYLSNDNFYA